MPTYQYACTQCGDRLEVVQKFTDDPLTECPACQGRLRKVFSPVGVVFKGSGFYKTDSRGSAAGAARKEPAAKGDGKPATTTGGSDGGSGGSAGASSGSGDAGSTGTASGSASTAGGSSGSGSSGSGRSEGGSSKVA